jgi:NAD(P)H-hydrate epimerase
MKVASAAEMRRIDQAAQDDYKIPGVILMERAAWTVLEEIIQFAGSLAGKRIYIFCGKGNNGGDGLALARMLPEFGAEVIVVLMAEPEQYRGLAGENLARIEPFGVKRYLWGQFDLGELNQADLIVDALLGTGTAGAPNGVITAAIEAVNHSQKPVFAMDLPSGINVDNGQVEGVAIKATRTITFGLPKPGLLIFPGADLAGELVVKSIGFPPPLLKDEAIMANCLTASEAGAMLPRRGQNAHKGTTGHVLAVGGSQGMTGALALTCLGALRAGCGLVTAALRPGLVFPEKPWEVMAGVWPELIPKLADYSSIIFGPGLTTNQDGETFFEDLISKTKVPLVIDADGLNIIARSQMILQSFSQPGIGKRIILTPHPGEMARLTGISVPMIQADRLNIARRFANQWNVTVVLKGARTIIAVPNGQTYINPTGNPGMATAGMGDLLAGIIAGFIAQGLPVMEAGIIGVYVHGLAGDAAAKKSGSAGIVAGDLLPEIPVAMAGLKKHNNSIEDSVYFR